VQDAERCVQKLVEEMHRRHGKPVLVCDFGGENATEIAHNAPCFGVINSIEHVAGILTYAFADYLARGSRGGAAVNQEGIFTRDRQPKQAAWELKRRFEKLAEERAAK
jgi:beta-glucuronidase